MQQSLLSTAEAGAKSQTVEKSKALYSNAVRELEKNNNSVVVSVGNQGKYLDYFAQDTNGARVQSGAEAQHNVLVNPLVTTVGATIWEDSKTERIADYNSQNPETDIYASGSVGNGLDLNRAKVRGTSFAAPRVAATLASLHGNHSGMPSSAMENLMKNRLTHETEGELVLDFSAAEEYMRKGTF